MKNKYLTTPLWLLYLLFFVKSSNGQCPNCASPIPINVGLVACYPFNNNANDATGNGNHATASNVTYTADRFGNLLRAGIFNGSSSTFSFSAATMQSNSYTYSVWVKLTTQPASGTGQSLISIGDVTGDQVILICKDCPSFGGPTISSGITATSYFASVTPPSLIVISGFSDVTNWHHVVLTRDTVSMSIKLFLDGLYIGSQSIPTTTAFYGSATGRIGSRIGTATQTVNGRLDDVRIYNRALSASEVMQLYNLPNDSISVDPGSDKSICVGDSVQLNAISTMAASYTWTPANSLSHSGIANPYAHPLTTTKYLVTATSGACSATDSMTVTVNNNCCTNCTQAIPLNIGLVTCYPLDGNANDMVSAANNGIATATTNTTNRFGRSNAAMLFNGSSSKIALPGTNLQLNNYTYSAWVKVTANPTNNTAGFILSIGNGVGPFGDQNLMLSNNYSTPSQTGLEVMAYTNPAIFPLPPDRALTGTLPTPGVWYHIVGIRSTALNKLRLFVNGAYVSEMTLSTLNAGYSTPVIGMIGARVNGTSQFFNGAIDDVRIYDRVLSGTEILALYNQTDITTLATNAGNDKMMCIGDSVQLNATTTGATSYSWSPSTGLNNAAIANPYAKPSVTTQYIVTASNISCTTTDTIIVTVNTNCCATCTTVDPINLGLLACLPFSGNTNNEADPTLNGTNNGATLTADRFGNTNRAYSFATNKSIAIPTSGLALNTYTYSTWVKITSLPASGTLATILSIGNSGALGDQTININNNYAGTSGFIASSYRAAGADVAITGVLPSTGIWYHIVAVRDVATNKIKLYVNGIKASEATLGSATAGYSTPILGFIGARTPLPNSYFNGIIDDARIYDRALSDAEISQLYTLANTPVITPISDKTICLGDSVQLIASGGTSYAWSPSTGLSSSIIASPYAKPSSDQQYIVNVSTGNCTIRDTLTVNVNSATLIVGAASAICKGDSIQLNASGTASYKWNTQATLSDSTIANPFAKPGVTTKYYITGTSGACIKQDSVTITVNVVNLDAGSDSSICLGDSIQLLATGATTYKWHSQTTLSDSTIANPFAKPTTTRKYFVTGTQGTCNALDSINITVNTINLDAGIGGTICKGDSMQLNATGAATYRWNTKTSLSDSTIANPYAKPLVTTKYFVTGKSGACVAMDSVSLVVPPLFAEAGANLQICIGDSVMLQASGGSIYKWRYNTTLSDSTIDNPYAKPTTTTKYFITVGDGVCSAIDSVTITIATSLNVDASSNKIICLGDSVQLGATGATSFKWFYNLTLSDSTISNPFAKPISKTKYFVVGTIGSCSATDSLEVDISTITADAGTNHAICGGDSIQLVATGGTSYKWRYNTSLSDSTIANPFAKPVGTSMYYVTISNGPCTVIDSANVTITATVNLDAGTNKHICLGDSVQFSATGSATTYKWRYNLTLSDSTIYNPFAKPSIRTKYFVVGTTGLCSATDSLEVDISTITVDAGTDKNICGGDSVQLLATGGTSSKWRFNTSLSDSTIANPFAKPASTTKYIVIISNGICYISDSVTVNVIATVVVDAGLDQQLCLGDSIQLQANGATTYTWLPIAGLSNTNISNPKASPLLTTDYIVKGEILACVDYDTVRVSVNPLPTVDLGSDTTKCIHETYTFNPTVANGDQYTWSPASLITDAAILNPTTSTTTPQQFVLKVRNTITGCENSDSVLVNINNPQSLFSLSDTLTQNPPLVVTTTNNSTPSPLSYQWFVNDSVPVYYVTANPVHTFQFTGRYPVTLTVTDDHGCRDTLTRFVTIDDNTGVFIPNVFTPNSDGLNDVFKVKYDVANTTLLTGTMWNRWGGQIYEFSMPNGNWWNGTAEGIEAATDVYYYIITITNRKNETTSYHGTITLLR
ncbi:MAG: LamG-like jellyroll fold domain-containing protein [Bacteroidota bacterium]